VATLFRVPEVAAGATDATLSQWLVEENSSVTADQPIVVIETDKAVVEVEAGVDAVLLRQLARGGETVEVGAPMALFGTAAERDGDVDALLAQLGVGDTAASGPATDAAPGGRPGLGEVTAAPEPETAAEPAVGDGPGPAPRATPGAQPASPGVGTSETGGAQRRFASPLARRILTEAGVAFDGVEGTGPGGRIVRRDAELAVQRAADEAIVAPPAPRPASDDRTEDAASAAPAAGEPSSRAPAAGAGWREEPHSRIRRTIARRLTESKQSIPHFYVKRSVRLDALLGLRRQLNDVSPTKISVNDLVLRAVAVTHAQVPDANAIWTEEAMRRYDTVDVAVAIAAERGLVTPVLRGVDRSSPSAIAAQVREYVRQADAGQLAQRDLEGGSIAVTNLGMYGVEEFSAIINPPHSAILAVGAAGPRPVVGEDGGIEVATVADLVLSVDHRVIDGALAARWMAALVQALQQPLRLLA
jgi:pyruvate dehydrogenase E2 component (dihydrolipoamide acetyltransferase)